MDTAKKTNLAKIALALLLAMMLSVFVSLGASATSDNRSFRFTTVNSTGQALINKAAQRITPLPSTVKFSTPLTVPLLMHMLMHVADTPKILLVPGPSAILLNLLIDT